MSRSDSVGLAKQTGAGPGGRGTPNTVPSYYVPVVEADPGINTSEMALAETIGSPFPTDPDRGVQFFEPSIRGAVRANSFPRLASAFFGDPVTTTPSGATLRRRHLFDPFANQVPRSHSLLLTRADTTPDLVDLLEDAVGNELTISVEPGGEGWIQFASTWVATSYDDTRPSPSVTADLTRRFPFYECKAYLTIGGGTEAEIPVSRFSAAFGLNPSTDQVVLGSRQLYSVPIGDRTCTVEFVPKEDLPTYYRRALSLTPQNVALRLEATGGLIEGAAPFRFQIQAFRLFEVTAPLGINAAETLRDTTVTARAALDSGASKFVDLTVENAVSAY